MLNFLKLRPFFFLLSGLAIASSLFSIYKNGFVVGIDFTGGTNWEISLPKISDKNLIQKPLSDQGIKVISILVTPQKTYLIKSLPIDNEQKTKLEINFKNLDPNYSEKKFETQGPSLGKELIVKTIVGSILAALTILLFIANSFKEFSFGLAAVLAMIHDVIILAGSFSIFGKLFGAEVDALFVTALLTTLSASIHDTVITFDRIRELRKISHYSSWEVLANQALSQTIVRSLNNSMTIIIMLFSLVLLGASTTRWFGTALLVGAISGTYSSFAIAVPLVVWLKSRKK